MLAGSFFLSVLLSGFFCCYSFCKMDSRQSAIISGLFTQIEHISHNFLLPKLELLAVPRTLMHINLNTHTHTEIHTEGHTRVHIYMCAMFFLWENFMKMLCKLNENILTMRWQWQWRCRWRWRDGEMTMSTMAKENNVVDVSRCRPTGMGSGGGALARKLCVSTAKRLMLAL